MNTDRRSIDELIAYMKTPKFRRRAKKLEKKMVAKFERGDGISFGEIADGLGLQLDVVVGGFCHAMAKEGIPFPPVEWVQ